MKTSDGYTYGPYSTSRAVMNYDAANDVVVVFYHDNVGPNTARKQRGVFVYDPDANAWSERHCRCPRNSVSVPARSLTPCSTPILSTAPATARTTESCWSTDKKVPTKK